MSTVYLFGFVLGIASAICFAFYMVPQKVVKFDHTTFLWTMGIGVLLTALVAYGLAGFPQQSTWSQKGIGIMCGVIWGLGTLSFAAGISRVGLAVATPIKNTTGVFGTLVGLAVFQEWRTTNPWLCVGGSLLIVAAAIVIGMANTGDTRPRATLSGAALALGAALCYASYLYPLKRVVSEIKYWEFTPWMALGILVTASVAVLVRAEGRRALFSYPLRSYGLALLGGVSWAIALFCLSASMLMVDLSVAWSLAQLNTLPAVFLGIYAFHEVSFRGNWLKITLGLLAATAGTILLGFSK